MAVTFRVQTPETEPMRAAEAGARGRVSFAVPDYRIALSRFERTDELVEVLLDVLRRTDATR